MPCTPQWSCFAWLFSYSQEYDLCPIPCSLAHLRCPIANKQYSSNPKFRHFRRQLYHSSLARILQSLKPGMTKPVTGTYDEIFILSPTRSCMISFGAAS